MRKKTKTKIEKPKLPWWGENPRSSPFSVKISRNVVRPCNMEHVEAWALRYYGNVSGDPQYNMIIELTDEKIILKFYPRKMVVQ